MITYPEALDIIIHKLDSFTKNGIFSIRYVLDYSKIEEKKEYWIFFYNSEEYIKTGDSDYSLIGSGPLIVDKKYGNLYELGSLDIYLEEFEKIYKDYQDNPEELKKILNKNVRLKLENANGSSPSIYEKIFVKIANFFTVNNIATMIFILIQIMILIFLFIYFIK